MKKEKYFEELKKGYEFELGNSRCRVVSDLITSGKAKVYYVDVITNHETMHSCCAIKLGDNQGIVVRNRKKLEIRGYTEDEIMAIISHELGHLFSENQQEEKISKGRVLDDELDSDTFAVEKCGIKPEVLESALKKDYLFKMKQYKEQGRLSDSKVKEYTHEMEKRIANARRLQQDKIR